MPVAFRNFPLMTNGNREDVIISTKFTPQIASDSPEAMQEMLSSAGKEAERF